MYYGLEGVRKYFKCWPPSPEYDEIDVELIDSILEGNTAINDNGELSITRFMVCEGTA